MEDLRTKVIKLAHQNPDLRQHLLPLLHTAAVPDTLSTAKARLQAAIKAQAKVPERYAEALYNRAKMLETKLRGQFKAKQDEVSPEDMRELHTLQLDVAARLKELAGIKLPEKWDFPNTRRDLATFSRLGEAPPFVDEASGHASLIQHAAWVVLRKAETLPGMAGYYKEYLDFYAKQGRTPSVLEQMAFQFGAYNK